MSRRGEEREKNSTGMDVGLLGKRLLMDGEKETENEERKVRDS